MLDLTFLLYRRLYQIIFLCLLACEFFELAGVLERHSRNLLSENLFYTLPFLRIFPWKSDFLSRVIMIFYQSDYLLFLYIIKIINSLSIIKSFLRWMCQEKEVQAKVRETSFISNEIIWGFLQLTNHIPQDRSKFRKSGRRTECLMLHYYYAKINLL